MRIELRRVGKIIKIRMQGIDHDTVVVSTVNNRIIVVLSISSSVECLTFTDTPEYIRFTVPRNCGSCGILCDTLQEAIYYFELLCMCLYDLKNEDYPDAKILKKSQVRLDTLK